jgi:hypothetical protein
MGPTNMKMPGIQSSRDHVGLKQHVQLCSLGSLSDRAEGDDMFLGNVG